MKDRKNILLQYQGGSYEGCYWEWNFCYWDKEGAWHNIFSSGRNGADTEQDALTIIEIDREVTHYVYDLDDGTQVLDFTANCHPENAKMVADYLSFNCGIFLEVECNICGSKINVLDADNPENELICEDCYREGACDECNEYYGDTSDFQETEDYGKVCEYCYERIQKEEQEDRNREALEQAKINGIIK